MHRLIALALLAGCQQPLPQPVLATVEGGNASTTRPQTKQRAILGPQELVLDLPGITDIEPKEGASWGPYKAGSRVRIPLVDRSLDEAGQKVLSSLFSGVKSSDQHLVILADASLPADTLMDLKDGLHWGLLIHQHLQVHTPSGEAWLQLDSAGSANRGIFLTPDGLTALAHGVGVPAYSPPAVDDVQARAQALVSHFDDQGGHTVLLVEEPERQTIQRVIEGLAAIDGDRMMMVKLGTRFPRRLEGLRHPLGTSAVLERIDIRTMDAADAAAHDRLLRSQAKLTKSGLEGVMLCYIQALEEDHTVAGELSLDIVLAAGPTQVEASGVGDQALHSCVEAAVAEALGPYNHAELELGAVMTLELDSSPSAER